MWKSVQTLEFDHQTVMQRLKRNKNHVANLGAPNGHVSKPKIQIQLIVFFWGANSLVISVVSFSFVGNNYTVEPRQYRHQGDTLKCPYYRGVHIKRVPRKKVTETYFIDEKTMAGILYSNKTT